MDNPVSNYTIDKSLPTQAESEAKELKAKPLTPKKSHELALTTLEINDWVPFPNMQHSPQATHQPHKPRNKFKKV